MKKLFAFLVLFIPYLFSVAQGPIITPLLSNAALTNTAHQKNGLKRAAGDTIKLPFFDDFTNTIVFPDKNLWMDDKVYINSHFPISPPSYGVATFDNLDAHGKPYYPLNGNTNGPSDSLTCKPINLKTFVVGVSTINYTIADSVYLSFFYQPQGLGDISDASDSLVLKFKDSGANWQTVWKTSGSKVKPFKQILIGIKSNKYFYNGFQFTFINYTKNTGNMNQWHLDYVRMKRNRSAKDTGINDMALNAVPYGPLKIYSTMPYNHFKANPAFNFVDSNIVYCRNNNAKEYNVEYGFQVRNQYNQLILNIPSNTNADNILAHSDGFKKITPFTLDTFSGKQPVVKMRYEVVPKADSSDKLQNDYDGNNANNVYTKTLQFKNVFAYDDGSAEGGFGLDYGSLPAGAGYAAIKYETHLPDTLRGISIFFNRSVADVSSKPFDLMVWQTLSEPPANNMNNDVLLRSVPIPLPTYIDTINGFTDYIFDTAVVLPQGKFYIGWKQLIPYILNVGYDNNYKYLNQNDYRNPNVFFNLEGTWKKVAASITGVPMMRPIVGGKVKSNVPGYVKNINTDKTGIYPNPSNGSGSLNIRSQNAIVIATILDITGKEVYQIEGESLNNIDISQLSSGLYTILLKDNKNNQYNHKYIKTE